MIDRVPGCAVVSGDVRIAPTVIAEYLKITGIYSPTKPDFFPQPPSQPHPIIPPKPIQSHSPAYEISFPTFTIHKLLTHSVSIIPTHP